MASNYYVGNQVLYGRSDDAVGRVDARALAAVASMQAVGSLFSVMRGRVPLAPVPTWLGGSSWRGRFGDSGVSMKPSSSEGEGGRRRALHDPISLRIVIGRRPKSSVMGRGSGRSQSSPWHPGIWARGGRESAPWEFDRWMVDGPCGKSHSHCDCEPVCHNPASFTKNH